MKFIDKLEKITRKNSSLLCVGLDLDINRIPEGFRNSVTPLFDYAKEIVDQTKDLVCAYKPNAAFFEASGSEGFEQLCRVIDYVPDEVPVILDSKRGDIGNTASLYARSTYEYFRADAVTLSPYLGFDSINPFLENENKFIFVLVRTSNKSSSEFQKLELPGGVKFYEKVAETASKWADETRIGFVVGATQPEELVNLRQKFPETVFLIPGIGSQGGDIEITSESGPTSSKKLATVNVSRKVIYPGEGQTIREAALSYKKMLSQF